MSGVMHAPLSVRKGVSRPNQVPTGQIALTRMPVPSSWFATVCTSEITAALEAEYADGAALARMPADVRLPGGPVSSGRALSAYPGSRR